MTEARARDIADFLALHGWGAAARAPLAGDASFRRYERLTLDGRPAVLMDAPPPMEDVRPFTPETGADRHAGGAARRESGLCVSFRLLKFMTGPSSSGCRLDTPSRSPEPTEADLSAIPASETTMRKRNET